MTLNCVWYSHDLKQRVAECESQVVQGLGAALQYLTEWTVAKEEGFVLRVYNSAVSFWFGFSDDGDTVVANSKSEFLKTRKIKNDGGV